jgi:uncharacterized protein (TIGR02266 family)
MPHVLEPQLHVPRPSEHPHPPVRIYGAEKRKHPRLPVSVDVTFTSGTNFYATKTRDMSEGGVFVETKLELPIGTEVRLCLRLLKKEHWVRCEVTWVLSNEEGVEGVGLRFLEIDPAAKRTMTAFMMLRDPMRFDQVEIDEV